MNADPAELEKFSAPRRTAGGIRRANSGRCTRSTRCAWTGSTGHAPLAGKAVLDVGCGGGILTEAMARRGASVTGIDLSEKALQRRRAAPAREPARRSTTRRSRAEDLAARSAGAFDVVTCMELLEHVPDPASDGRAPARSLVRPGGQVFFSTINRNPKSYLFAVIGAEYVLRPAAEGHARLPALREALRARRAGAARAACGATRSIGMTYNPLTRVYSLGRDCDVNYLLCCVRGA